MPIARALASPASLKGVLSATAAAVALAEGLRSWAEVDQLPVADGGEGTLEVLQAALGADWHEAEVSDAFGQPHVARWLLTADGSALVEAAEAIPLDPRRLDPFAASSRGLGELIRAVGRPRELHVFLGGTANVDGGAGLLEVLDELPAPTRVAYDAGVPLLDAARVFAAQKGATPDDARELEARLLGLAELMPYADLPGAGAAGGLGAALASLGAELLPGAPLVLDLVCFDPGGYDVVVTGEGTVDRTTTLGKAPGEVARRCALAGVRCIVFAGRIAEALPELEVMPLSGDPTKAEKDLVELGRFLGEAKAQ
jgi:glycerate 2-kinase